MGRSIITQADADRMNAEAAAERRVIAMAIVTRLEDDIGCLGAFGDAWDRMELGARARTRDRWVNLIVAEMEKP